MRQAARQLRDRNALEGALARPRNYAHYHSADIAQQAAVLTHGIAETQPFVDGNKRVALTAMLTFLAINGFDVEASQDDLAAWIVGLSQELDPEGLVQLLRRSLKPSEIRFDPD